MVFQCLASSVPEGEFFRYLKRRLFFRKILRAWVLFQVVSRESRLSSDLWSEAPLLPREVGFDRVIEEEGVLVEIVFGFVLPNADFGSQ